MSAEPNTQSTLVSYQQTQRPTNARQFPVARHGDATAVIRGAKIPVPTDHTRHSIMSNHYPYRHHQHQHPQQQLNGMPMLPHQQNLLHQPPIVYGNYNIPSSSPQYSMHPYYHYQPNIDLTKSSPASMASSNAGSPRTPPTAINHGNSSKHLTHVPQGMAPSLMVNPLVPPPPPPPLSSSSLAHNQLKSTEDRVKATIARANALPLEFYQTEFLEYSTQQPSASKKRKRVATADDEQETGQKRMEEDQDTRLSNDEIRRQIHIQSEQKRRAQIKGGFEELKQHLPGCSHKKLSKAALLTRTVQQLEHMKKMQNELLAEVERLAKENLNLKRFAAVDTHM
ncbi:hypothetical protein MAM1_0658c11083 [Mucor ambiguus]|uniref:BHLH domain-containing protein n=1 Tax=Mucor ambiguus TaxID=91626 RepID=A0A0C9MVU3_9FUNG|nr:hypothetical protein MAM1_0658c11083 [Mucor ambiguus]